MIEALKSALEESEHLTKEKKIELVAATGLDVEQIASWFSRKTPYVPFAPGTHRRRIFSGETVVPRNATYLISTIRGRITVSHPKSFRCG
ncbi:hypothetical protein DH2020_022544 [Rehmannia glutinosa]|uniref:Homeobox domain-containing protein n=1 Tax=Rehmannia glutinosa TaxID=99300 RepID=A0ABR0WHA8_REHGL